jgi:hypothetical protein
MHKMVQQNCVIQADSRSPFVRNFLISQKRFGVPIRSLLQLHFRDIHPKSNMYMSAIH